MIQLRHQQRSWGGRGYSPRKWPDYGNLRDLHVVITVGRVRFITLCCYERRRLVITDESRPIFELALERVRRSY